MLGQHKHPSKQIACQRRHVCIVTETYPPEVNGVAFTLARLAEGLRDQGYRVSVVRPRQKHFDDASCRENSKDTLVRGLPLPGYNDLRIGLPAGRALGRQWARQPPDVIYVATEGPLGLSAVRAARSLNVPILSGFHTNFHSYSRHYHAGCLDALILRYLCWFHNQTAGTIVASTNLREQLRSIGVNNISVLGRGVDSRLFDPDRRDPALRHMWGAGQNDLVALYVGRLAPEKNLALAIGAYRAMQRAGNAARFVIVGDGPLGAALAEKHPDLIFLGVRTGEELARCYASADVFLFPSETETFGNVTLEALASGLVVVAYNYAAAHLHIRDRETGVLVPYGDAKTFIESSAQVAREPQFHFMMRRLAREYAASLDWQRVVQRFALLLGVTEQIHLPNRQIVPEPFEQALGAL